MKKLVLIAAILGALSSVPSRAETWDYKGFVEQEGVMLLVGRESLRANKPGAPQKSFWVKFYDPKTESHSLHQFQLQCSKGLWRETATSSYKKGQLVSSNTDTNSRWQAVLPDSIMARVAVPICSKA